MLNQNNNQNNYQNNNENNNENINENINDNNRLNAQREGVPQGAQRDYPSFARKVGMEPTLRVLMMPQHVNVWGTVFGGVLLTHMDEACGLEAVRHTKHKVVTVAVKNVVFHEPVLVADMVSLYTSLLHMGRTSMSIGVEVVLERRGQEPRLAASGEMVFVTVDDAGQKCPVAPII